VTVFPPAEIGKEVEVEVVLEVVASVQAAMPTLHRIMAPANIRHIDKLRRISRSISQPRNHQEDLVRQT